MNFSFESENFLHIVNLGIFAWLDKFNQGSWATGLSNLNWRLKAILTPVVTSLVYVKDTDRNNNSGKALDSLSMKGLRVHWKLLESCIWSVRLCCNSHVSLIFWFLAFHFKSGTTTLHYIFTVVNRILAESKFLLHFGTSSLFNWSQNFRRKLKSEKKNNEVALKVLNTYTKLHTLSCCSANRFLPLKFSNSLVRFNE